MEETAMMISRTLTGGEAGFNPKTKTKINSPTPPAKPIATPLFLAPSMIQARIIRA